MQLKAILMVSSLLSALSPTVYAQSNLNSLPYATQRAAQQFPVTLYTGKDCGQLCNDCRTYLQKRGIPYTEKIVTTPEMLSELKRVANASSIPVLMVGRSALNGFKENEWKIQLDAAGYPNNGLPKTYRPQVIEGQAAQPAAPAQEAPEAEDAKNERIAIPKPPPPPKNAPPGFRF